MSNVVIYTDVGDVEFMRSLGAYQIASQLREHGYTTQVIDHFTYLTFDQIMETINKFVTAETLFIGFSSTFMLNRHKREDLQVNKYRVKTQTEPKGIPLSDEEWSILKTRVQEIAPKAKLVKGGVKATAMTDKFIDTFIVGYGDKMVIDYIKFLDGKNPLFLSRRRLPPNEHQRVIDYDTKGDQFAFTTSSLKWEESDLIQPNEPLPIEVSRGCIFRCKFCSYPLNGKKKLDFVKDVAVLKAEMIRNYELFGTTQYVFMDDTYNDRIEKIDAFGNMFRTLPFKMQFISYLRHDLIWRNKESADILLESGLVGTQFGIETLNYEAGKAVGKGLPPEQTIELLYWLRDVKWGEQVLTHTNFILGLPKDTRADIERWSEPLFDPSFPLHSWSAKTMMLKHRTEKKLQRELIKPSLQVSEIGLDYKAYGYDFPDPTGLEGKMNWVNTETGTSFKEMHILEQEFNARRPPQRILCWGLMQLQTLGYEFDDLRKRYFNIPALERLERRTQLVNKYYDQLMRL